MVLIALGFLGIKENPEVKKVMDVFLMIWGIVDSIDNMANLQNK